MHTIPVRAVPFVMLLCSFLSTATAADRHPKVLFIGVDGCRWDAVETAKTPHWDALVKEGYLAVGTEIIAPRATPGDTVSGPGWSNLLCGVWPDKHGVVDNSFRGSSYRDFPHFFARVKQARPEAATASFSDWGPIAEKILSGSDHTVSLPAHGAADYREKDSSLARDCAEWLRKEPCDVVMLYLGQVDETGHAHGFHPSVPEYVAAIERVDALIGLVSDAVRQRNSYGDEDWLILVATDHGGAGTGHGGGREIPEIRRTFLIVSGRSAIVKRTEDPTYQVDVVATALRHLAIEARPDWGLDGVARGLRP